MVPKKFFQVFLSLLKAWSPKERSEENLSGNDTRGYRILYSNGFLEIIWSGLLILPVQRMLLKEIQGFVQNHGNTDQNVGLLQLTVILTTACPMSTNKAPNHSNQWLLKILLVYCLHALCLQGKCLRNFWNLCVKIFPFL